MAIIIYYWHRLNKLNFNIHHIFSHRVLMTNWFKINSVLLAVMDMKMMTRRLTKTNQFDYFDENPVVC